MDTLQRNPDIPTDLPPDLRVAPVPPVVPVTPVLVETPYRPADFRPPRRHWPGLLAVAVIAGGVAALVVSGHYDPRSVGQKLDASIGAVQQGVNTRVEALKQDTAQVAERSAEAGGRAAAVLDDVGITAAVKAALATDPALSALRIEVRTEAGVVTLSGPAPSAQARDRAAVLAAAPQGVHSVDNRLVVSPPPVRHG